MFEVAPVAQFGFEAGDFQPERRPLPMPHAPPLRAARDAAQAQRPKHVLAFPVVRLDERFKLVVALHRQPVIIAEINHAPSVAKMDARAKIIFIMIGG